MCDIYMRHIKKDKMNARERRVFLFVILALFNHRSIAGQKMAYGLRMAIGEAVGLKAKSTISDNLKQVKGMYENDGEFKKQAEKAYKVILSKISRQ